MAPKVLIGIAATLLLGSGVASADHLLPPTVAGQFATVYVGPDGRVVGGPLHGMPYFGVLVGTEGDDVIVGTEGDDVIVALGGNDWIMALGGNDQIEGFSGDDYLDGGNGFDIGIGGPGWDTCTPDTELRILCEHYAPFPEDSTDENGSTDPPVPSVPGLPFLSVLPF